MITLTRSFGLLLALSSRPFATQVFPPGLFAGPPDGAAGADATVGRGAETGFLPGDAVAASGAASATTIVATSTPRPPLPQSTLERSPPRPPVPHRALLRSELAPRSFN